jgi:hypothetical protein
MRRLFLVLAIALFLGAVLIMLTTQGDDDPNVPVNETETSNDVGENVDGASEDFPEESPSASPSASPSPSPSGSLPASSETLPPELANAGNRGPDLEPQGSGGSEFALGSAGATEPRPDAEKSGLTPKYPEATSIDIKGARRAFTVTLGFDGQIPKSMPDENTFMVVGFALSGETEDDDGYAFGAQGNSDGWEPYAGRQKEAAEFPGSFSIGGNNIEMTIPWKFIGGPRPFEWYANSSWFTHTAGVTSYLFDVIPDSGGRYPQQ